MHMSKDTAIYHARRSDRLGVHSLDHVGIYVPDLGQASVFYGAFGLDVRTSAAGLELRAFGNDHVWGTVATADTKLLGHVSFGAYEDDIDRIAERLSTMGVTLLPPPANVASNGVWFRDPHDMLVEIRAAPKVMPDEKAVRSVLSCPAGERGAVMRGETRQVRPTRMAHALFFTPDIETSVTFFRDALGLRVSDYPGPVAFLHGPHGSDHHLIAFAQSAAGIGFHHSAWDVASLDDVGLGAAQMASVGFDRGWGLGRHVLGSNYFHYVRDPWGSYAEYSYDIDFVPAEQEWKAGYPAPENSLFLWGPGVPEDFVTNFERPGTGPGGNA
jgi:catechol 2,3-dioxygenase-like lactoylglutathione lyase family enzyme